MKKTVIGGQMGNRETADRLGLFDNRKFVTMLASDGVKSGCPLAWLLHEADHTLLSALRSPEGNVVNSQTQINDVLSANYHEL